MTFSWFYDQDMAVIYRQNKVFYNLYGIMASLSCYNCKLLTSFIHLYRYIIILKCLCLYMVGLVIPIKCRLTSMIKIHDKKGNE